MPWQGDRGVVIDRFDGRAHLDFLPEYPGPPPGEKPPDPDATSGRENREVNYERYRILVQNEFLKGEGNIKKVMWESNFGTFQKLQCLRRSS